MTSGEALKAMEEGKKVTHKYFSRNEYLCINDGHICDEENCNWDIKGPFLDTAWEDYTWKNKDGWSVYNE